MPASQLFKNQKKPEPVATPQNQLFQIKPDRPIMNHTGTNKLI